MQTISRTTFSTVKSEGALLPVDLLQRVFDAKERRAVAELGLRPEDYHLLPGERLNEAINRSWNRCLGAWTAFAEQRARLPDTDSGTTLTRSRWLLTLFQELGYGRLQATRGVDLDDGRYPISHMWGATPIHLVTFRQDLDKRSTVQTALKRTPHSLVQEFLNRSDAHLWAFVSNGLRLRILRDNASFTRPAYVEFDLESMMTGERYADFALLWFICHQSRVEAQRTQPAPDAAVAATPDDGAATTETNECWLERWMQQADKQGARALDTLRDGVQEAIEALGRGFLAQAGNDALKAQLRSGALSNQAYYRQLLRIVYRLIFLLVAEDRNLLLPVETTPATRARYERYYSLNRLRTIAEKMRGGPHGDLWRRVNLLFTLLRTGYAPLGIPGLDSFLFSARATPALDELDLANHALLDAVRALAFTIENGVRRSVDYRNLDSEELGSVYESLLELHPTINIAAATFALEAVSGSERKTTGSYYTPPSLVNALLDSALEPVVAARLATCAEQGLSPREAILAIKVVDPACGSGHFLIGAARRLARHLARIQTGDEEPAPDAIRAEMRTVVSSCIHGVDINAMAVELCKVALWMETLEPGKPLGFLDKNIQCGNSLIGVTPGLDISEIPDDAFKPVTGDDKTTASALRKRNRTERTGQDGLRFSVTVIENNFDLARWRKQKLLDFAQIGQGSVASVQALDRAFHAYVKSDQYRQSRLHYDLWTAAFFWPIPEGEAGAMVAPTQQEVRRHLNRENLEIALAQRAEELATAHQFFHWPLAFEEVFDQGGFDVVLGNPPWERIKLQEKEWFATRVPEIANAPNAAARRKMIAQLAQDDPELYAAFESDRASAENQSLFIRSSKAYPLCGRGDVNTYAIFAELARTLINPQGRTGIIVPSGIATDDTTKYFFQDIMEQTALVSLYDFENRRKIFEAVDSRMKFCLLTMRGTDAATASSAPPADFVFFALDVADLRDEERRFTLTAEEIGLLNPNTRTCPIFRSQRDAVLTKAIYRRMPVLVNEEGEDGNPWGISFLRMFDMSNDSHLFRTREQLAAEGYRLVGNRFVQDGGQAYLPLYEAKMTQIWDHRAADVVRSDTAQQRQAQPKSLTYESHIDPYRLAMPLFWIDSTNIRNVLPDNWNTEWFIGFTNVSSPTNERSFLPTLIPFSGVGNSMPLILPLNNFEDVYLLIANLSSLIFDYVVRQKMGGVNLNFFLVKQFPVLNSSIYNRPCTWNSQKIADNTINAWLVSRILELTYTAWDMQPFAQDCGYDGPPFRWDEDRRFLLRCELDAAYFHLYGIARADVDYIMETFPIVKRKDEQAHGEYRTKRVILEMYDAMAQAMATGMAYQTRLDPPPADARVAHGAAGVANVSAATGGSGTSSEDAYVDTDSQEVLTAGVALRAG